MGVKPTEGADDDDDHESSDFDGPGGAGGAGGADAGAGGAFFRHDLSGGADISGLGVCFCVCVSVCVCVCVWCVWCVWCVCVLSSDDWQNVDFIAILYTWRSEYDTVLSVANNALVPALSNRGSIVL